MVRQHNAEKRKNPDYILMILITAVFIAAGCVPYPTMGVKGSTLNEGFLAGARFQNVDPPVGDSEFGGYFYVGYVQKEWETFDQLGSFFKVYGSIPFKEEHLNTAGVTGGTNLLYGGYDYSWNEAGNMGELHISGSYGGTATLSKFWGDTNKEWNLDLSVSVDLPMVSGNCLRPHYTASIGPSAGPGRS